MEEMILLFNPWWKTNNVRKSLVMDFKRTFFDVLVNSIKKRQITAIYGLRRIGKSTLLFQTIDYLLKKNVPSYRIFYFSFDEKILEFNGLVSKYLEMNNLTLDEGEYYFFFDEVQKLDNWQNKIKVFYDLYPNIKFFISGSSNFSLFKNASESLAGRIEFLNLLPLSFEEWININKLPFDKTKINLFSKELRENVFWYFKTPFPEIATERSDILIRKYVDDIVLSRIISYDIKKEFHDADTDLLYVLKNIFFESPGFILNVDSLSRDLGRGKEILLKHINYLQTGLIIKIVRNYRKGELSSSRKLKKVYPYHPCFTYGIEESIQIENFLISQIQKPFYWREKEKEVDLILNGFPIEIKYKNDILNKDLKNIRFFMRHFNVEKGTIISKDAEKKVNNITFMPFWKVAFVGLS